MPEEIDIFEDNFAIDNMMPGVSTRNGVQEIKLPPTMEGMPEGYESSFDVLMRKGAEKSFDFYPKGNIASNAYRKSSKLVDAIGVDFPDLIEKYGLNQISMTAAGLRKAGQIIIGPNPGKTLREMEMERKISPFQLIELGFVGLDFAGAGAGVKATFKSAFNGLNKVSNFTKKSPVENYLLLQENPELMKTYSLLDEGTPFDELSEEAKAKLGVGSGVTDEFDEVSTKQINDDLKSDTIETDIFTPSQSTDEIAESVIKDVEAKPEFTDLSDRQIISKYKDFDPLKPKDVSDPYLSPGISIEDEVIETLRITPSVAILKQTSPDTIQKFAKIINSSNELQIKKLRDSLTPAQYEEMLDAAEELLIKNSPTISASDEIKKIYPQLKYKTAADDFIKANYMKMSDRKMLDEMKKDPDKYFYEIPSSVKSLEQRRLDNLGKSRDKKTADLINKYDSEIVFQNIKTEFDNTTEGMDISGMPQEQLYEVFEDAYTRATGLEPITTGNTKKKFLQKLDRFTGERGLEKLRKSEFNKGKPSEPAAFKKYFYSNDNIANIASSNPNIDKKSLHRYLNFIRESSPTTRKGKDGNFDNFMNEFDLEIKDLKNTDSIFYKQYQYFKEFDDVRDRAGEKIKPFLNQIFPSRTINPTNNSLQIAHRFENTQIGNTVPKGLEGTGGTPSAYYLDISVLNSLVQSRKLEPKARKAIAEGNKNALDKVEQQLESIGAEIVIDGKVYGRHKYIEEKLLELWGKYVGRPDLMKQDGVTQKMLKDLNAGINIISKGAGKLDILAMASGGMVEEDIFEEPMSADPGTRDIPTLPTMEDQSIFDDEASYDTANLILPLFKLFGKPPKNTFSGIPIPKSELDQVDNLAPKSDGTPRPKKEILNKIQQEETEIFDPTPDTPINIADPEKQVKAPLGVTPYTKQPATSVFYSDIERVLSRPDAPKTFNSKEEVFSFLEKNNIKDSEKVDYRVTSILKDLPDGVPIDATTLITQIRQAPIAGIRIHGTGFNSEIVNPQGYVRPGHDHYYEPGSIPNSYRERVLIIPKKNLPGDSGQLPENIQGEGDAAPNHNFGQGDDNYTIGWSRLTDRVGYIPPKISGPVVVKGSVQKIQKILAKQQSQQAGLFGEITSKLQASARRRVQAANGALTEEDIARMEIKSIDDVLRYENAIEELSPGMIQQVDDLQMSIDKSLIDLQKVTTPSTEGYVRVTFADEIQSDLLQEAARRKQYLGQTLKQLMERNETATDLSSLAKINKELLKFYEDNKSVFRPQAKSAGEVDILRKKMNLMEDEVADIIDNYVTTREISDADIKKLSDVMNENMNSLFKNVSTLDSSTMDKLFPDIPFKNRNEWSDAIIKADLYEAAYRKFVLKDPNAAEYYAVSPSNFVKKRYSHKGGTNTSTAERAAEKQRQLDYFNETGELTNSRLSGVGMDEFYGGPNVKAPKVYHVVDKSKPIKQKVKDADGIVRMDTDGKPLTETTGYQRVKEFKPTENAGEANAFAQQNSNFVYEATEPHYKGTLEKILQKQAKENNSEFVTMPIQLKQSDKVVFKVTDQNGNMVATLTNRDQAADLLRTNPNYKIEPIATPDPTNMDSVFAIKITKEMLEPYVTHKAMGGLVEDIDIFEVA